MESNQNQKFKGNITGVSFQDAVYSSLWSDFYEIVYNQKEIKYSVLCSVVFNSADNFNGMYQRNTSFN